MTMRFILVLFSLIGFVVISNAQFKDTIKFKPSYYGSFLSGAQIGCTDCSLSKKITVTASLVNGIQVTKRFSTGLGIGFDSFEQWKTLPLFLHLSYKLLGKKNGLYAQFNSGYAYAWMDKLGYELPNYQQRGGLLMQYALTYQYELGGVRILFSGGFKKQTVSYTYRYDWSSFYNENKNILDLNRVFVQIGFGWK
jgi:hypothetical protein